ncbi:MAG TPA: response regulator [Abditibacterium sp.]|jgi:DNA-binding response OmpR family regulator
MQNRAHSQGRIKILMAEDSLTQALKLRRILDSKGYEVEAARNGREAFDYLLQIRDTEGWADERPTLVISDIVMPEMDGCQLCYAIKNDEKMCDLPVILLTSLSDTRDALRGLYSGADNLISKPYEAEFLLGRIDDIVSNLSVAHSANPDKLLPVTMDGQKYFVSIERLRSINLILTTYETAAQKNLQLEALEITLAEKEGQLQTALATIEKQVVELTQLRAT